MKGMVPWILLVLVVAGGVALYLRGDRIAMELRQQIDQKEQEREAALVLADSLREEVASADSLAEAITDQLTKDLERSRGEVVQLRSSADSIMHELELMRQEIPPAAMELVQSLQQVHKLEVAEYNRQLHLKDQMMSWKDFQIQERDRYIQGLRAAQQRANELIALQDAALNPTFAVKIKKGVVPFVAGAATMATAALVF